MKKKLKKTGLGLIIVILALLLWQHDLVLYGLGQARGQLKIITDARPVEEFMSDPEFPDSLKNKLQLIAEVRQFAFDSLGLNYSDNYTSLYDQGGKPILWVVNACEAFELKNKEWTFPLLGAVSYKGFFDLAKAEKEEAIWKAKGYDTRIRTVGGWSTLGFLDDPILSNMLNRRDGDLAELIVHELTHGTLYIPDSVSFNENLASFIGKVGARKFMKVRGMSEELQTYLEAEHDDSLFTAHMLRGVKHLQERYEAIAEVQDTSEKQELKDKAILQIQNSLDTVSFHRPEAYAWFQEANINNTFFMGYVRYYGSQEVFAQEFKNDYNGDIRAYIVALSKKYPSI